MSDNNLEKRILVTRSSMPELSEYVEEISSLWDSHWLTNMGKKHNELTERLKDYLGADNIELLVNGHSALEFCIQAMDFPAGSEVITTPFTFASTTHAITRNGLVPVFCDVKPDDYCMDPSKIEALITEKTVAVLPVHVYGHVCDFEAIDAIAKKHNLKVIYDAAHTFGIRIKDRGIASLGDASMFSFHATKVFNTIEGGCVCYRDEKLGKEIYYLKDFGIVDSETINTVGANGKMNEFAAAMGLCNLRHVDDEIAKRKLVVERYRERLGNVAGIQLGPDYSEGNERGIVSNYAYFPVVFDKEKFGVDRNVVFERLAENNIGARKYFYPITNTFECYRRMGYDAKADTPIAYELSMKVLTLPLYADLELSDVDRICDIILGLKDR